MAKDEAALRLAKLQRLMPALLDLHAKTAATLEELDDLLGGGAGIGAKMKAVSEAFDAAWGDRYAGKQVGRYSWNGRVDMPHMKRLIKMLGIDELLARIGRYVADEDPYKVRARHPFGLFVSNINSYAASAAAPADFALDAPTVAGCKHEPKCASDQVHTTKKMAELRG